MLEKKTRVKWKTWKAKMKNSNEIKKISSGERKRNVN